MIKGKLNLRSERMNYSSEEQNRGCWRLQRNKLKYLFFILCGLAVIYSLISFYYELTKIEKLTAVELEPFSRPLKGQCSIMFLQRFDCFPRGHATEELCIRRGCCWEERKEINAPHCFYPLSYSSYEYVNISEHANGITAYMELAKPSVYPDDVKLLRLDVNYINEAQFNLKIFDPNEKRYEPPDPILNILSGSVSSDLLYQVKIIKEKLGFQIIRKSNNGVIFDTQDIGGFTYANQFLQISALLPSEYIYGLGHQRNEFLLQTNWNVITLFNHDLPVTDKKYIETDKTNFYSSHPFYLLMENSSLSHGVLLLNSNAMDIILQPAPAITYRTIGGIMDFYFFLGPSPTEVIQQYTALIGRPYMPPYWSLGFHLSRPIHVTSGVGNGMQLGYPVFLVIINVIRLGYKSVNETLEVLDNNRLVGIPVDTQWNDLDYMDKRNDFTYNSETYAGLNEFVEFLHNEEMHYVILIDPGVSAGEEAGSYPPYDEGISEKVFIMDHTGEKPFLCRVWNRSNKTAFPDFSNPKSGVYWQNQIDDQYKNQFKFDGIWLDMNEPTNFINGSLDGCVDNSYEKPPYMPNVDGELLSFHTVCMSAKHHAGIHYNLHNIYGLMQTKATTKALESITRKRAFVITRATFPGIGHYSGSWTGDVSSTWDDMKYSVADILSFNLFGIPLIGADICGFNYNTTVPLCQRWSQLGAFYPFSRNHNSDDNEVQDPYALGPDVILSAKKSLTIRYFFLPYLYTLFWEANIKGTTVARPVFFEFPDDELTYSQYQQFFWGSALLICPVLLENETSVTVYLPEDVWYDYYSFQQIYSDGSYHTLLAPLDRIPLLLRGGNIIPAQIPASTTAASRRNKMSLIVAPDVNNRAKGTLFWDDGESLNTYENKEYNLIKFELIYRTLVSKVVWWNFNNQPDLGSVTIIGVKQSIASITVNGELIDDFSYDFEKEAILLNNLSLSFNHPFTITWSS